MITVDDYIDARELDDEYKQIHCPECGVERWFKHSAYDYGEEYWRCVECNSRSEQVLEYSCPICDTRMIKDGPTFMCQNEGCGFVDVEVGSDTLIDRLSDDAFPFGGKNMKHLECPLCGERSILSGPDGELQCDECNNFHVGQYQDEWYCYAIWMQEPELIRVNRL